MRKLLVLGCAALWSGSAVLTACTGDDTDAAPVDGGASDGGKDATTDAAQDTAAPDGAQPSDGGTDGTIADAGDAGSLARYLLLSYGYDNYSKTELSAFSLSSGKIAGGVQYAKFGTNVNGGVNPWLLNQAGDVVSKMDANEPWKVASSWSVALPKENDAGAAYSDPSAIAETSTKAYVALFNRNTIAVIDTTKTADGGAPTKLIDMSSLRQTADDTDGYVELTSAVYVAAHKRVYVVVGNTDLNNVDPQGFFLLCGKSKSVVAAIDVDTDTLVSLGDAGGPLGSTITLNGTNPVFGGLVYDAKGDRLLVMSAGCNAPTPDDAGPDAGKGPMLGRVVEQVSLADNTTKVLYDANHDGFPGEIVYADEHHAWLQLGGVTNAWDPASTALGALVGAAPDSFVYDGKGSLVGPRSNYLADGGFGGIDIVSVQTSDGGVTKIGSTPVTSPDPGGYFEGITLWPQ